MYPPKFNIKIHIFYKQLLLNLICTVFSCSTGVLNTAALCRSLSMINPTAGCLLLTDLLRMFQYMSPKYYSITDLNCHFSATGTQVPHFFNDLYANSDLNLLKKKIHKSVKFTAEAISAAFNTSSKCFPAHLFSCTF